MFLFLKALVYSLLHTVDVMYWKCDPWCELFKINRQNAFPHLLRGKVAAQFLSLPESLNDVMMQYLGYEK